MNKEHTMTWGDGVEVQVTTDENGRVARIELPPDQRPDIDMGAEWYEEMMREIRESVANTLNARKQLPQLTDGEIDAITWKVHAEACYLNLSEPESSGAKGGRPRDTGAEIAARAALDTAEKFGLPGRGVWEESVSGDLLNLIETVAKQYKGRLQPVSFKRRYRLQQGRKWTITPLQ